MKHLLLFENYTKKNESNAYSLDEYNSYIRTELGKYDLRPAQVNHLLDFYSIEIESAYNEGNFPKNIVDKIISELELGSETNYPTIKIPNAGIRNLKYL